MSFAPNKAPWHECAAVLWTITFLLSAVPGSRQSSAQLPSRSSASEAPYFPSDVANGLDGFFSSYLRSVNEPSLLAASKDLNIESYRLDWLGGQTGRLLSVRLSINSDGTAKVFTTEQSSTPSQLHKTENSVAAADVQRFLKRVEKADFWSMPTLEAQNSSPGPKAYKTDASSWAFEGVHNGHYHVVLRPSPESSAFTEMVGFLAKQIAKLDDSSVPRALPRMAVKH